MILELENALNAALTTLKLELPSGFHTEVNAAADLRFGDYQANTAMVLAKRVGMNPRQLATEIIESIDLGDLAEADIAGPGFINFRVKKEAWCQRLARLLADDRLGVPLVESKQKIVVDFSAPNVAKPMHVGHIRSTIIGESLARIARFLGHEVVTDNHIGDWGTQFGMIIHGWKTVLSHDALDADPVVELLRVYRVVNGLCAEDDNIRETCKLELVKLQGGDLENLEIWRKCVELSKAGLQGIYERLDVSFDFWHGESFYNERLVPLVEDMLAKGVARESNGAICVFFDGDKKLESQPAIVRKADGGFLYATTDLATIDYRVDEWKADQIWYVVGAPQQLHFQQVFEATRKRGLSPVMHHIAFGSILGEDRKLMKTRSGDNVQLVDVLDEAVERASKVIEEKNPEMATTERENIAEIVGIGAVKFAELSQHRMTDYVFSWDRMLALQGDTAPYLQYSYVRVNAIFRKLEKGVELNADHLKITEDGEVHLARMIVRFSEVVPSLLDDFRPNLLANYLLELAKAFHSFFEACPVLKSEGEMQNTRLVLCELTSRVLVKGLGLLGIEAPERM